MAFYSLPLEKNNAKISEEYCYLVLAKYTDKNFQPEKGKKKLTAQELKEKKERLLAQTETIKQLDTGYCNLHNHKIDLSSILDSFFVGYLRDYENYIIYKIQPLASYEKSRSYDSRKTYEVSEFNIAKKFKDTNEIIDQIHKDKLLPEFSAVVFDKLSYTNEDYNLKLFDYFKYINDSFDKLEISLSDIVLNLHDYKNEIRDKFRKSNTGQIVKDNIKYLLDNKLIKYFKESDYYHEKLIISLVDCGLFDVALNCIKLLDDYHIQQLLKEKTFDIVLRKWSTDEVVKEIISVLGIKLSGLTLTVKECRDYGDDYIVEVKNFDNIGEVKTHLIKNYDVPFDTVMSKDIDGLQVEDYVFSVI